MCQFLESFIYYILIIFTPSNISSQTHSFSTHFLFFLCIKSNLCCPSFLDVWSSTGTRLTYQGLQSYKQQFLSQHLPIPCQVGIEFCAQLPLPCWSLLWLRFTQVLCIQMKSRVSSYVRFPSYVSQTLFLYNHPLPQAQSVPLSTIIPEHLEVEVRHRHSIQG